MEQEQKHDHRLERDAEFGKSVVQGSSYRVRKDQLVPLSTRRTIMTMQPGQTLVVVDIPDHPLNAEDGDQVYLRTMQQKILAFCRGRRVLVTTRRGIDPKTDQPALFVIRKPNEENDQ